MATTTDQGAAPTPEQIAAAVTRDHVGDFTPEQLRALMSVDRIMVFVNQQTRKSHEVVLPGQEGFSYLVLAESPGKAWPTLDAWRINAQGFKDPGGLIPAPVLASEAWHLDFADYQLRHPLQNFSQERVMTMVFACAGEEGARSLGVGLDVKSARANAIERLCQRFPGVTSAMTSDRADYWLGQASRLLDDLESGDAKLVCAHHCDYPTQAQMGHNYMSFEGYEVARVLTSDAQMTEKILALPELSTTGVRVALTFSSQPCIRGATNGAHLIDWSEVANSFADVYAARETPVQKAEKASQAEQLQQLAAEREISGRRIAPEVLEVLARCIPRDTLVRLPDERLDPMLYKKVDEVLRALGGKWVGRKVQAHQFEEDPAAVLAVAVATGSYVKPQDFGYFPTPEALVEAVLPLADIQHGMKTLEPSAGVGAFAVRMAELCGGQENVTVCELLPGNARKLREAGFTDVQEGDFLSMEPQPIYDRILMNPPFNGGVDIDHVLHAARFLKPDGKLTAITGTGWEANSSRKAQAFRDFIEECEAFVKPVQAGAFKSVGTNVATRIVAIDAENLPWNRVERVVERQRA